VLAALTWVAVDDRFPAFGPGSAAADGPRPAPSDAPVSLAAQQQTASANAQRAAPPRRHRVLNVESGDTMMAMLRDTGISRREAFEAITALKDVYSPRDLRPGQQIHVALTPAAAEADADAAPAVHLAGLRLRASAEHDVALERQADGFAARAVPRDLTRETAHAAGRIDSSLMAAAHARDIPMKPLLKVIHGFSYAIDFQRDLRKGNRFEVLYQQYTESGGDVAKVGPLLYAALEVRDKTLEMYRFEQDGGRVGYFNGEGESVRRLLMRTPINGARLSSGYGMREHPILGYSRMHEGVDFAAPTGTPIYAAGNGRVDYAGWKSGYGRYIRIRHQQSYKTAYGHLSRFAPGVHGGARVSQGEVIGYVGSTGRSTGPHLHYEILKHGRQVNPRDLDLPTGYRLTGAERERFLEVKAEIDAKRRDHVESRVAAASCSRPPIAGAATPEVPIGGC
jgi:murein DD-endopeptidase MepM/ murein hydrolase activator NlpD